MAKHKYLSANGPTMADDPKRFLWHGVCGCWTDEWDLLSQTDAGIPICPNCGCPGFQTTAEAWDEGVAIYEKTKPGYTAEVETHKIKEVKDETQGAGGPA